MVLQNIWFGLCQFLCFFTMSWTGFFIIFYYFYLVIVVPEWVQDALETLNCCFWSHSKFCRTATHLRSRLKYTTRKGLMKPPSVHDWTRYFLSDTYNVKREKDEWTTTDWNTTKAACFHKVSVGFGWLLVL